MSNPDGRDDDDAPELTGDLRARLRPAADVLPAEVMANFRNKGGRPKAEQVKTAVNIRLSPEVVAYYKAGGRNWQTRLNADLEQLVAKKRA